jgi:hypothetical protein
MSKSVFLLSKRRKEHNNCVKNVLQLWRYCKSKTKAERHGPPLKICLPSKGVQNRRQFSAAQQVA